MTTGFSDTGATIFVAPDPTKTYKLGTQSSLGATAFSRVYINPTGMTGPDSGLAQASEAAYWELHESNGASLGVRNKGSIQVATDGEITIGKEASANITMNVGHNGTSALCQTFYIADHDHSGSGSGGIIGGSSDFPATEDKAWHNGYDPVGYSDAGSTETWRIDSSTGEARFKDEVFAGYGANYVRLIPGSPAIVGSNVSLAFKTSGNPPTVTVMTLGTDGDVDFGYNIDVAGHIAVGAEGTVQADRVIDVYENYTDTGSNAYGLYAMRYQSTGGNTGHIVGVYGRGSAYNIGANTLSWAVGVGGIAAQAGTTGTVTNAACFRAYAPTVGSGTITTAYGLYIPNITVGGANYSIWTGTAKCLFGGEAESSNKFIAPLFRFTSYDVDLKAKDDVSVSVRTKADDAYQSLRCLDLYVYGDDIYDSGANVVLSFDGSGAIDATVAFSTQATIFNVPWGCNFWYQSDTYSGTVIGQSWSATWGDYLVFSPLGAGADGPQLILGRTAGYHIFLRDVSDVEQFRVTSTGDIYTQGLVSLDTDIKTINANGILRVMTSTADTLTRIRVQPNGSGAYSQIELGDSSDSNNFGMVQLSVTAGQFDIISGKYGTGTAPTTLNINDADFTTINIGGSGSTVYMPYTVVMDGGFLGAGAASDQYIWGVSTTNPTWGIYYNEGTPDYIEFHANAVVKNKICLGDGHSEFQKVRLTQNDLEDSGGNVILSGDGSGNIDALGIITDVLEVSRTTNQILINMISVNPTEYWRIYLNASDDFVMAHNDGAYNNFLTVAADVSSITLGGISGATLNLQGGTTTGFTIDASGNVTKVGQDSPSTDDVLTWDGAKAIWSPGGGSLADHTHASSGGEGGQLDWDDIWSDADHSHESSGEGGTLLPRAVTYGAKGGSYNYGTDTTERTTTSTSTSNTESNLSLSVSAAVGDFIWIVLEGDFYGANSSYTTHARITRSGGTGAASLQARGYAQARTTMYQNANRTLTAMYRCTTAGTHIFRLNWWCESSSYAAKTRERAMFVWVIGNSSS